MSDKQTNMEQSEPSLTDEDTTADTKPALLASLNYSDGLARLSLFTLKRLITSMERMGVESVLIGQISLSPFKMATKKFGKPRDSLQQNGNSS
jgi:hypothetical protein